MGRIFNTSGGFRKLHTFNFATIIHLGTISFCKRYIPWKDDPLGKTLGQMVGASRSGKQNIIDKKFDPWLEGRDDITAANALIVLIQRTTGLLGRQLNSLEEAFVAKGGIKEKMFQARVEARSATAAPDTPACPQCEKPMRKRRSAKGEFWGCSGYPECKGVRRIEEEKDAVTE